MAGHRPGGTRQVALVPRGDEAGAHQAVAQQFGEPPRVADVRLAARHGLQVSRVEQPDREAPLQDVMHRLPVLSRALEPDMGAAVAAQPVRHRQQLRGRGAEGPRLCHRPATRAGRHQADHHRPLVDIDPRAALEDHLHGTLLPPRRSRARGAARGGPLGQNLPDALPPSGAAAAGTWGPPGQTDMQARRTRWGATTVPAARVRRKHTPIFMPVGGPAAHAGTDMLGVWFTATRARQTAPPQVRRDRPRAGVAALAFLQSPDNCRGQRARIDQAGPPGGGSDDRQPLLGWD